MAGLEVGIEMYCRCLACLDLVLVASLADHERFGPVALACKEEPCLMEGYILLLMAYLLVAYMLVETVVEASILEVAWADIHLVEAGTAALACYHLVEGQRVAFLVEAYFGYCCFKVLMDYKLVATSIPSLPHPRPLDLKYL